MDGRGGALRRGRRGRDAFFGERRHRREHFVEGREAVQVAMRERHHHALAQPPQPRGERICVAFERQMHFFARIRARFAPRELIDHFGAGAGDAGDVLGEPQGAIEGRTKRLRSAAIHH